MADNDNTEHKYRPMQAVKRHFFAMRNGVIADTLRQAGSPFRYIFGMNLPQLVETAEMTGKNSGLAEELWANRTTRESMLLAPMLMPTDEFTKEDALRWTADIPAVEVADILCHRLLRKLPFASEIVEALAADPSDDMRCYTAGRLALNLIYTDRKTAEHALELLKGCEGDKTAAVVRQLSDCLAYL